MDRLSTIVRSDQQILIQIREVLKKEKDREKDKKKLRMQNRIQKEEKPQEERTERKNKSGYTATSCGRVGRGGNARFPTFRLDHYGRTDRRTDRWTDKDSYRVACPQLKTSPIGQRRALTMALC